MKTMKATLQNQHCGGTKEANHNDRSFDISKADNIGDITQDQTWIFPDNGKPQRLPLQHHALRDWEMEYYSNRFGNAVDAQREKYLKVYRQKKRAEECTVKRYYDSVKTGPDSTVLQVDKEGQYTDRKKFIKMVTAMKHEIEEETEDARIKVLSISVHGSETSLHVHLSKTFEVRDEHGNWVQDQDKCLKKLGYELPDKEKKKQRYNNRKETWSDQKREKWYDIIERIDPEIKIDRTPSPDNPRTKGKANRAITEMTKLKKIIRELASEMNALQNDLARIGKDISKADLEKRVERIQADLERHKITFGKMAEYIGIDANSALEEESEDLEPDEDWER